MDSVAGSAYGSEGVTVGSGARIATNAVAETSRMEVTIRGGLDEATQDRTISVVPVIRAAVVGVGTRNLGAIGYPMSSLKVAPKLLETGMSITSTDMD